MICRGSQTVARANLISGTNIPEEKTKLLRNVISEKLQEEDKNVPILFLLLQIKFLCHIVYRACDIHHCEKQRYGKCTDDYSVHKTCNLLMV